MSLAHHGVLFLDELLEFPRSLLDALRQPLEDGRVVIARARRSVTFPARFTLIAATNPCPCGQAGDPRGACHCSSAVVARYQSRLSGPLADRIDVHVAVGAVPLRALGPAAAGETSATMRGRVDAARGIQYRRYATLRNGQSITCNAHAPGRWLQAETPVAPRARDILVAAAERLALSARGYHRVLKVARTIADLEGDDVVGVPAVAEALRYRPAEGGVAALAGRRGAGGGGAV